GKFAPPDGTPMARPCGWHGVAVHADRLLCAVAGPRGAAVFRRGARGGGRRHPPIVHPTTTVSAPSSSQASSHEPTSPHSAAPAQAAPPHRPDRRFTVA